MGDDLHPDLPSAELAGVFSVRSIWNSGVWSPTSPQGKETSVRFRPVPPAGLGNPLPPFENMACP